MEFYMGQIIMFGGNFAIRSFAMLNGQLLPISQNSALFSLLGTTYGGDGRTTFALPEMRGRTPMHFGNGPGVGNYSLGQKGGTPTTILNSMNLPAHTHQATGKLATGGDNAITDTSAGNLLASEARGGGNALDIYNAGPATGAMADNSVQITIGSAGQSQPFNNLSPFTTVNFLIALQGIYPSRN